MTDTVHEKTRAPRRQRPLVALAGALLLPLFFVVVFPLTFVSAMHNPTPHDVPILVVGPEQAVSKITTSLDHTRQFSATQTDVAADARSSVRERRADGSLLIEVSPTTSPTATPTFSVTAFVAQAEGPAVSAAVQSAAQKIASQLNTTAHVIDVAPLAAKDSLGTSLFYLLVYSSLGAYLVIIVLMQVMPNASLRARYTAVSITAVTAPLLVFGLSAIFVGDYGASFATIAALLGIDALYVFTIGAAAILIEQFLGRAATFGVMAFIVMLNFPAAGGAVPASFLPPFWQFMHSFYVGAGAFESFRSIIYFGGNEIGRWLLQLLAWTIGLILITVVVQLSKTVRRQRNQLERLLDDRSQSGAHRRSAVELPPATEEPTDADPAHAQRSLAAPAGAPA